MSSKILTRVQKKSTLFADGCRGWVAASKKYLQKRFLVKQVVRARAEFTKALRGAPRKGASTLGGTQCFDKVWDWLKAAVPRQVSSRKQDHMRFVHSWLRRHGLPESTDVLTELSKECSSA